MTLSGPNSMGSTIGNWIGQYGPMIATTLLVMMVVAGAGFMLLSRKRGKGLGSI